MSNFKFIWLVTLLLLLNGCSWNIAPFVRNHTNQPIEIIVKTGTYTPIVVEYLNTFYHPKILDLNAKSEYHFNDSLRYEIIDSTSFKLVIPEKSTAHIGLPYGWRYRDYSILFKHENGQVDS